MKISIGIKSNNKLTYDLLYSNDKIYSNLFTWKICALLKSNIT